MNKNIYMITDQDKIAGTFSIRNIDTENWISNVKVDYLYLFRIAILPEYQAKILDLRLLIMLAKCQKIEGNIVLGLLSRK